MSSLQLATATALSCFRLLDLIAQLGGAFVVFGFDRPGQLLAELGRRSTCRLIGTPRSAAPRRNFADVMRRALMGPLQQRRQVLLEQRVIVLAAEQPALAELRPGDAAVLARRAGLLLAGPNAP